MAIRPALALLVSLCLAGCNGRSPSSETPAAFDGPCEATGTWLVEYDELPDEPGCWMPVSTHTLLVDAAATPPVTILHNYGTSEPITDSTLSEDGCTLNAAWGWEGEDFGEPQGEDDDLTLVLTDPDSAEGSLTHSEWWWCGGKGTRTFVAHAKRQ